MLMDIPLGCCQQHNYNHLNRSCYVNACCYFLGVYWEVEYIPSPIYSFALLPFLEDLVLPQGISLEHCHLLWWFLILRAILWLSWCEWFMLMAIFFLFSSPFFELKNFLLNFSYPEEALYISLFKKLLFGVPEVCNCWTKALLLNFYPCGSIILCHIQDFPSFFSDFSSLILLLLKLLFSRPQFPPFPPVLCLQTAS